MYEVDKYTVSLLHFEDGIKDECGNLWSGSETVQFSNDIKKIGAKSISFKNDNAKITPKEYSKFSCLNTSGTFSIDFWVYVEEVKDQVVLGMKFNDTIYNMLEVGITKNNKLEVGTNYPPAGDWIFHDTANTIQMNSWNYIYVAITPDAIYTAINGKVEKNSNNLLKYNTITELSVGNRCKSAADGHTFKGYIDEFRISNIARWTEDFTPPTEPVKPTPTGNTLLRITMNDSSEREYKLSSAEIDDFVKWYERTVGTGNTCYAFNDIIDNSKEYLVFEKIISFKVVPLAK